MDSQIPVWLIVELGLLIPLGGGIAWLFRWRLSDERRIGELVVKSRLCDERIKALEQSQSDDKRAIWDRLDAIKDETHKMALGIQHLTTLIETGQK